MRDKYTYSTRSQYITLAIGTYNLVIDVSNLEERRKKKKVFCIKPRARVYDQLYTRVQLVYACNICASKTLCVTIIYLIQL